MQVKYKISGNPAKITKNYKGRNMPKSSKHHSRDRVATDFLRALFPKTWLFKSPRDVDSGREYSEDWIIEIVDEDEHPTGIEFCIQNKTGIKFHKSHISFILTRDDIKRFVSLQRPVLLHAHDTKNHKSYWKWFAEWYGLEFNNDISDKKTVTIRIPLTCILDDEAIKSIRAYASWVHRQRTIERNAELVNVRYKHDFHVSVSSDSTSITTLIYAKHEKAIPTVVALDENASNAMIQAIELGQPVPLVGRFALEGIPEPLREDSIVELEFALIWPHIPEHKVPVKIEFLDEAGEMLLRSPFVLLEVIQPGTMVWRMQGKDEKNFVTYTFSENKKEKKQQFAVTFECKSRSIAELTKYFDLVDRARLVKQFKITYLDSDPEEVDYKDGTNFFPQKLSAEATAIRFIIKTFILIETELGISILLPEKIDDQLLQNCELITKVLFEGEAPMDIDLYIPKDHIIIGRDFTDKVRDVVERFEKYGYIDLYLQNQATELTFEFMGHLLNFGRGRQMFKNCKILNLEYLKSLLQEDHITEDRQNIVFEPDREQAVWQFFDWPREL